MLRILLMDDHGRLQQISTRIEDIDNDLKLCNNSVSKLTNDFNNFKNDMDIHLEKSGKVLDNIAQMHDYKSIYHSQRNKSIKNTKML